MSAWNVGTDPTGRTIREIQEAISRCLAADRDANDDAI
jgi:hypothetical protein